MIYRPCAVVMIVRRKNICQVLRLKYPDGVGRYIQNPADGLETLGIYLYFVPLLPTVGLWADIEPLRHFLL